MNNLIDGLTNEVIPNASTANIKAVAQAVVDNMKAYEKNPSYDYKAAGAKVKTMYDKLSSAEQTELKQLVMNNCYANDYLPLLSFFGF